MNNTHKKILPFPKPLEEPANSPIVVQIGSERFAIHYEIEDLPPGPPEVPVLLKPRAKSRRSSLRVTPVHLELAILRAKGHQCVDKGKAGENMRLETKFFRLRTEVAVGSRFDDWTVCWLGGWSRHRLYYLVMLVKVWKQEG